ncbi:MAG: hypothetical protein M1833_006566 [Piccolia ochrophora]|nr:MAG: hypothetical protein M1833_006566 [Piccolia ochrophora]
METLLSLAFDNLSSYDTGKIRKGLRQVEGLLAQICLAKTRLSPDKRRSIASPVKVAPSTAAGAPKELAALRDDPAFREFYKLQEGFEWNDGQNDLLILSTLDLIRGILLLHPPSRSLFAREIYMNVRRRIPPSSSQKTPSHPSQLLLDLLDPANCPAIQSSTLLTLVVALLDQPSNTRAFESLDGLLAVTSLSKQRGTAREVKAKLSEFLYFYLLPETTTTPPPSASSSLSTAFAGQNSSIVSSAGRDRARAGTASSSSLARPKGPLATANTDTRSTEEKMALLGRHLGNVDDVFRELQAAAPFGRMASS